VKFNFSAFRFRQQQHAGRNYPT